MGIFLVLFLLPVIVRLLSCSRFPKQNKSPLYVAILFHHGGAAEISCVSNGSRRVSASTHQTGPPPSNPLALQARRCLCVC